MADDFGLRIGIEGEYQFKKALRDINQSFKVLASEMANEKIKVIIIEDAPDFIYLIRNMTKKGSIFKKLGLKSTEELLRVFKS